jgi:hypothetical protein
MSVETNATKREELIVTEHRAFSLKNETSCVRGGGGVDRKRDYREAFSGLRMVQLPGETVSHTQGCRILNPCLQIPSDSLMMYSN